MIVIEKKHTIMIHCILSLAVCAATPRGSGLIESVSDRRSHCHVTSRYYMTPWYYDVSHVGVLWSEHDTKEKFWTEKI